MTVQVQVPRIAAGRWTASDSRTRIGFTVGNLGRPVHGSVACGSADVDVDDAGSPVRVRAEMDLNSIHTGIAKRDSDLRKPRLLDIDRNPSMVWTADRFTGHEDGTWTAEGEIFVRGTRAPLTVTGTAEPAAPDGSWIRVRASGTLDRATVGIRVPRVVIGRTVEIQIDAWLRPS
ncbi:MAG TPA: YceI family protein [Blastococcus sp.]|nr:YceI family protein [Blastococcus sp.]